MTNIGVATNLPAPIFGPPVFSRLMISQLLDDALKVIPSQQLLVNVVSRRVRQLTAGHRPLVEVGPRMGFSDIALKEIIEGKITYEMTAPDSENGTA